jgi:hypothetical protein
MRIRQKFKRTASKLALIATLTGIGIAIAGNTPKALHFTWDWTNSVTPDVFKLYCTTNISSQMTNWTVIATVPGTNHDASVTMTPGAYFFVCTASNIWGESPFSNQVGTPPALPPKPVEKFQVSAGLSGQ